MNKPEKVIEDNKSLYIRQIIIGAVAFLMPFIIDVSNYLLIGIPYEVALPVLGLVCSGAGVFKMIKSKHSLKIEIYENHLVYGDFESNLDELLVTRYKRTLQLNNGNSTVVVKEALKKDDYNYLLSLSH